MDKYIGGTEKNLEKVFAEAESLNAVLFFDEADALFGSRSEVKDAKDRYANQEIAYLLQRMEQFDGITVLATNLRGNLDPAFSRRLHFVIHFPDPDVPTRRELWRHHLANLAGLDPDDPILLDKLAVSVDMAGGDIRNIVSAPPTPLLPKPEPNDCPSWGCGTSSMQLSESTSSWVAGRRQQVRSWTEPVRRPPWEGREVLDEQAAPVAFPPRPAARLRVAVDGVDGAESTFAEALPRGRGQGRVIRFAGPACLGHRPAPARRRRAAESTPRRHRVLSTISVPSFRVAIQLGARAGGSHGPVVNSSVSASSLSLRHLVAVER